ncbi:MAG TPA: SRPBCC family protein [Patescibacteria group bacterium]|nr:SRPBCC family protein [Patescibacteria group bacterium]
MNTLKVIVNKPAAVVFEFCLNPDNTPKWIDTIEKEETNEKPSKLGTIYKNKRYNDPTWTEYKITEFEDGKSFTMSETKGNYRVKYVVTPINNESSELEYSEWVDNGEPENPFTQEVLDKLKDVIEKE